MWGQRVFELVGMFAIRGNNDHHFSGKAFQFTRSRIRHNDDGQLGHILRHRPCVLQDKAAATPFQGAGDFLNGNIGARAFDFRTGGEHLALARGFQIAVILLV